MNIKGVDAKRAEETRQQLVEIKAKVDQSGQAVLEAIDRQNQESIPPGWKAIAEKQLTANIESFVDVLWNQMCRPDGLEFTAMPQSGPDSSVEKMQMHCTYCPWAEIARAAGAMDVGYYMFCKTDPHMVAGFNQAAERKIKFSRSKTIMQGDLYCDHCYEYEDKE